MIPLSTPSYPRSQIVQLTKVLVVELPRLIVVAALEAIFKSLLAELVVLFPQLLVFQHLVGFVDFDELGVSIRIVLSLKFFGLIISLIIWK